MFKIMDPDEDIIALFEHLSGYIIKDTNCIIEGRHFPRYSKTPLNKWNQAKCRTPAQEE